MLVETSDWRIQAAVKAKKKWNTNTDRDSDGLREDTVLSNYPLDQRSLDGGQGDKVYENNSN